MSGFIILFQQETGPVWEVQVSVIVVLKNTSFVILVALDHILENIFILLF